MNFDEIQEAFKKTHYYLESTQGKDCLIPEVHELFDLVNSKVNFKNHFNPIQIV
jgi:hypothetical protein